MSRSKPQVADSVRVGSIEQFVQAVCRRRDEWIEGSNYFDPWFRGQKRSDWLLQPNIFRLGLLEDEDEIRAEFQRRAPQYMTEVPPIDHWGWYFLMQHYGAPTRLLDWSDSALIALFFAIGSTANAPESDAVVWMLDPWWLNRSSGKGQNVLDPTDDAAATYLLPPYDSLDRMGNTRIDEVHPIAVDPPFIARRVAVQKSRFVLFGRSSDGLDRLAGLPDSRLVKIVLAKDKINRMRADLFTLGISDTSVYPDLRGLSDEIVAHRLGEWPPV